MKWYLHWEVSGINTFYSNSDREEFDTEEEARKRVEKIKKDYSVENEYNLIYSLIHGTRVEYQ